MASLGVPDRPVPLVSFHFQDVVGTPLALPQGQRCRHADRATTTLRYTHLVPERLRVVVSNSHPNGHRRTWGSDRRQGVKAKAQAASPLAQLDILQSESAEAEIR